MLTIILKVDAPAEAAQGIKEAAATLLEPLGAVRVVSVTAEVPEQMKMTV